MILDSGEFVGAAFQLRPRPSRLESRSNLDVEGTKTILNGPAASGWGIENDNQAYVRSRQLIILKTVAQIASMKMSGVRRAL